MLATECLANWKLNDPVSQRWGLFSPLYVNNILSKSKKKVISLQTIELCIEPSLFKHDWAIWSIWFWFLNAAPKLEVEWPSFPKVVFLFPALRPQFPVNTYTITIKL